MKALTLTQPWATLVAIGAKRIETRSWLTVYRGPLAIHAAKGFPKWAREFTEEPPVSVLFGMHYEYPRGEVLATCRLVACKRIVTRDHLLADAGSSSAYVGNGEMLPPTGQELSFGDYTHGRYAWIFEDIKPLPRPIPAKGALGLWDWEEPACA